MIHRASGRRLWWVGVVTALFLILGFAYALVAMVTHTISPKPSDIVQGPLGAADWISTILVLGVIAALLCLVNERLRRAFGYPEPRSPLRGRWWLRSAFRYIDNQAGGFVWFLNAMGCIVAPVAVLAILAQLAKLLV